MVSKVKNEKQEKNKNNSKRLHHSNRRLKGMRLTVRRMQKAALAELNSQTDNKRELQTLILQVLLFHRK